MEPIVGKSTISDPALRISATLPNVVPLKKDLFYYLFQGDVSLDRACVARVLSELAAFSQARSAFAAEAESVLRSTTLSHNTFLLDALDEASESLEQRRGRGILILLSDGLEDSRAQRGTFNFAEATFWPKHAPASLVRSLAPNRADPGIRGTRVYLDGLAAPDGQTYTKLREFWTDFFLAARAEALPSATNPVMKGSPHLDSIPA